MALTPNHSRRNLSFVLPDGQILALFKRDGWLQVMFYLGSEKVLIIMLTYGLSARFILKHDINMAEEF